MPVTSNLRVFVMLARALHQVKSGILVISDVNLRKICITGVGLKPIEDLGARITIR